MIFLLLLLPLFLAFPFPAAAKYDPRSVPNNKYGIHVADSNDVDASAPLVNSSGGDWGYVTIVIPQTDRNSGKWQDIFNRMRRLHLIPIVRLATETRGDYWTKPDTNQIKDWISFLTSLNWPIENRYIVLFNEPNHANEWGRNVVPEEYADIVIQYAKALKAASDDFFVLPAGLDASASNSVGSMDEKTFLDKALASHPELLDYIDGWTSHSYPNPGFMGSPYARGRGTLSTYLWELDYLTQARKGRDLPVFITETGWAHVSRSIAGGLSADHVAQNILTASVLWSNSDIVAITPFVYSYLTAPFDQFSWKIHGTDGFYPQYNTYQNIPKVMGKPKQRHAFSLVSQTFPDMAVTGSTYNILLRIKNDGQSIFDRQSFHIDVNTNPKAVSHILPLPTIEPSAEGEILFVLTVPETRGAVSVSLELKSDDTTIVLMNKDILLVPAPSLAIQTQLGFSTKNDAGDVRVLVYNSEERLVFSEEHAGMKGGLVEIPGLTNVSPGEIYRVVVLVPYYLPRQAKITLHQNVNVVKMKRLWPMDFNNDGTFTISDFPAVFHLPAGLIKSLFFTH